MNRPAGNSGLAKAAIKFFAKIEHPLGSHIALILI